MNWGYALSFFAGFFFGQWWLASIQSYKKRKEGMKDGQEEF